MYNLSTSLIPFQIIDNGQTVHEGTCPYEILWYVEEAFLRQSNRTLHFQALTYEWDLVDGKDGRDSLSSNDPAHPENKVYRELTTAKELDLVATQWSASWEQALLTANAEKLAREEERLAEIAQDTEEKFQAFVRAQSSVELARIEAIEAENYRLDMLRAQTVTQVAIDPMTSVTALESEVGTNLDVQRQISASMLGRKDVALLIINSNTSLWYNSYDIMETLAKMSVDPEIADALIEKLPEDSILRLNLINLKG